MIAYEVTVEIRPELTSAYEHYMLGHVPDLLSTGCFVAAELAQAGTGKYRTRYLARTRQDLDRYLAEHAPRLRADFELHFPSGAIVGREVWEGIQEWPDR